MFEVHLKCRQGCILPSVLECRSVIDLCVTDLQTHGHRQLLLTDEKDKELILSPTPKQANMYCQHFIASKCLILQLE